MKLSFDTKKIFQNGMKDPAMLAGAVIVYGVAMAAAVVRSIRDSNGGDNRPKAE